MVEILKKCFKPKIRLLALFVSALFIIGVSIPKASRAESEDDKYTSSDGVLVYSKTAEKVTDDQYKINFNVKGEMQGFKKKKVNVLLMIDTSGSMMNGFGDIDNPKEGEKKIDVVNKRVKEFCQGIRSAENSDVMVSLGHFNGHNTGSYSDAKIDLRYTSDFLHIENMMDLLVRTQLKNAATDVEAAINIIGDTLQTPLTEDFEERIADKTYVILFSDGLPTMRPYEAYSDKAEDVDRFINEAEKAYNNVYEANKEKDIEYYSIGIFNAKERGQGLDFLKKISSKDKCLEADNDQQLKECLQKISKDIEGQKVDYIAKSAVVTDYISEDFELPSAEKVKADILSQLQDEIAEGKLDASQVGVDIDESSKKVVVTLGTIKAENVGFYILVAPKNKYFSGTDIPTNEGARLDYIREDGNRGGGRFKNPTVRIDPKKGSVEIEKIVKDKDGKVITDVSDGTTFDVSLVGDNESYGFDLKANEPETMNFYMRDNYTDVDRARESTQRDIYESMKSNNYLLVGNYRVNEICPMNYELNSIEISYDGINYKSIAGDETFKIDKDNPNVKIRITNTNVNDKYWTDKEKIDNLLQYHEEIEG